MTIEEQMKVDKEKLRPIVEEIFSLVDANKLCYREYRRMIDLLVHEGSSRFVYSKVAEEER